MTQSLVEPRSGPPLQFQSGRPSLSRRRATRPTLMGPAAFVPYPPDTLVKLPPMYSQLPEMVMARTSATPVVRATFAVQDDGAIEAPVVGSRATMPFTPVTPLTLVNSPPTSRRVPSGEAITFHTGALMSGANVGIHSPVFTSNAAR